MPFALDSTTPFVLTHESWSDGKNSRAYTRKYDLHIAAGASGYDVGAVASHVANLSLTDLPRVGYQHPVDPFCYCTGRACDVKQGSHGGPGGVLELTVNYSTPEVGFSTIDLTLPWNRPPTISGGGGQITEVRLVDADGEAVVNSAGDLLTDIPPQPVIAASFVITRYEQHNPANRAAFHSWTTCEGAWHGVEAEGALMGEVTWSEVREAVAGIPTVFYQVSYPVTVRYGGQKIKLLDHGFKYVVDDAKRTKTDDTGTPTQVPILLDGSGGELADGADPVYFPEEGRPFFETTDWELLDLPDPFADATA